MLHLDLKANDLDELEAPTRGGLRSANRVYRGHLMGPYLF